MIGSIRIAARRRTDRPFSRFQIAERHLVESVDYRAKPVEIFLLPAGCERRQGAAVEGALEGDDAVAFGPVAHGLVLARSLDRALHRLSAGVCEEHQVGEARLAQPRCQPLRLRDAIEVRDVNDLFRLLADRRHDRRMRMAERIDRNPGGEIEVAFSVRCREPRALASLESKVDPRIGRQNMRCTVLAHRPADAEWK